VEHVNTERVVIGLGSQSCFGSRRVQSTWVIRAVLHD